MSDKYTWRDGWGLTVVKASPKTPTQVTKEPITRCDKEGNYIYKDEPCTICQLEQGRGK